jgi:hypothetical protein
MAEALKVALLKYLDELGAMSKDELLARATRG